MNEHLKEIDRLVRINRNNKYRAIALVVSALVFSFVLLGCGIYKYGPDEYKVKKVTESDVIENTVLTSCHPTKVTESLPVTVSEESYSPVIWIQTVCVLAFVSFSLWGAFTVLLKVLKSEYDVNMKILEVLKDVYKEEEMKKIKS